MRISQIISGLLLLVALPFAADAQEKVVVSGETAKLFKAASFDGAGAPLARGVTLTVLERKGDWVHVYDGKTDGFVHNAYLSAVPAAATPANAGPQAAYQPPPQYPPQGQYPPQAQYPPQQPQYPVQAGYPAPAPGAPIMARMPGTVGYKDPSMSRIFSIFVIGGGHFYSGETGKGITLAALGYGAPILASMFIVSSADDCINDINNGNYYACDDYGSSASGAVLASYAVTLGSWIYGMVDSDNAAMRTNAKPMRFSVTPSVRTDGKRVYGSVSVKIPFGK
jgi:hypothetical protein